MSEEVRVHLREVVHLVEHQGLLVVADNIEDESDSSLRHTVQPKDNLKYVVKVLFPTDHQLLFAYDYFNVFFLLSRLSYHHLLDLTT